MISFHFNIRNPYIKRFEIVKCWYGKTLFPNKFWELQVDKTSDILSFDVRFTTRQDHAGLYFELGLFGFEVIFNFYDHRHWNDKEGCWEIYGEDK